VTLRIGQPGMLTTVQDLGRTGHQRFGVPVSGAMDPLAHRVANLLVGNEDAAAALEITLLGPTIVFDEDMLIALAGADLGGVVGDRRIAPWHAAAVPAGSTLRFAGAARGCRAYLAVAGGIDVPTLLGSRSTYIRAALGGLNGGPLRRDDVLSCGVASALARRIVGALEPAGRDIVVAGWGAGPSLRPSYGDTPVVRLLDGTHTGALTPASRERLYGDDFRVSPQSDRMGYRLEGPTLDLSHPLELLSEGVAFGTMQLPPAGSPIVLMADRQTTGGYPRVGEVVAVDLPLLAQLRPGDRVRFRRCSLDEAHTLYLAREHELAQLRRAITLRHS